MCGEALTSRSSHPARATGRFTGPRYRHMLRDITPPSEKEYSSNDLKNPSIVSPGMYRQKDGIWIAVVAGTNQETRTVTLVPTGEFWPPLVQGLYGAGGPWTPFYGSITLKNDPSERGLGSSIVPAEEPTSAKPHQYTTDELYSGDAEDGIYKSSRTSMRAIVRADRDHDGRVVLFVDEEDGYLESLRINYRDWEHQPHERFTISFS